MKLRDQLILNNGLLLAVVLAATTAMSRSDRQLIESTDWVEHSHEVMSHSNALAKFMVDMETGQRGFMLTGNESFLEPYRAGQTEFDHALREAMILVADDPRQGQRLQGVKALQAQWLAEAAQVEIELRRRVDRGELTQQAISNVLQGLTITGAKQPAHIKSGKQLMDQVQGLINEIVVAEESLLQDRLTASHLASSNAQQLALWGSALAALLTCVLGAVVIRKVARQLGAEPSELQSALQKVAEGELSREVEVHAGSGSDHVAGQVNRMICAMRRAASQADAISRGDFVEVELRGARDELGLALRRMTDRLREVTQENQTKRWIQTGQTLVADTISGQTELRALGTQTINALATYLQVPIGAFYVLDEPRGKQPELNLYGNFGFSESKSMMTRLALGQGLVGEVARGGQQIVTQDVPERYFQVHSALGSASPRHVAVTPLAQAGTVIGVLEVASFSEFTPPQLKLLNLVSEGIAVGIHTAHARQKLRMLLAETQRQTEELALRQAELQQANTELEGQTQNLKESEDRLKQSNQDLEDSSLSLRQQRSDLEVKQEALEQSTQELARSNRYKSEFLSNMSHELRTPLNSILILSKSLAENHSQHLDEDEVQAAEIVNSGGEELLTLINEILDLSKIEAGKMDVEIRDLDLQEALEGLKHQFAPIAQSSQVDFLIEAETEGVDIQTDSHRLRQILKNLLSNAFKFTSEGCVTLRVEQAPATRDVETDEPVPMVAFSVIDTGQGIPKDRQLAIFEAFQQADGSTTRTHGGTGLGLTISVQLAQLLGGELQLETSDGSGSTFTLSLPGTIGAPIAQGRDESTMPGISEAQAPPQGDRFIADTSSAPVQTTLSMDTLRGRSVLLVDDDARNLFAVGSVLAQHGLEVENAINGQMALNKLENETFDILVMDLMMPVMDGLEAIRELRTRPGFGSLPALALTARSLPEDRRECLAAGFTEHMAKPADISQLIKMIEQLLLAESDPEDLKQAG